MSKCSSRRAAFSAIVFTMLCLFPSVGTAQTPGEPQQGAINTSRSNLKSARTASGRFDPLVLDLKKASGENVLTSQIADLDNDGKLSEAESAFNFGVLPEGEYELRFSDAKGYSEANRGITISSSHVEYSDKGKKAAGNADPKHNSDVVRLSVTLTGVVGGPMKQELKADLDSTIDSELARAGKPKFKNVVVFKADGRSAVKGTLRHDIVMNSIRNLKG